MVQYLNRRRGLMARLGRNWGAWELKTTMEADEFRKRVTRAFGDDLHRASPASVREFLDKLHAEMPLPTGGGIGGSRIIIDETAKSYEEVMRTFFMRVLDMPSSDAVFLLWAVALDLSYAVIESHDADRIGHLFKNLEEPPV